MSPFWIGFAVGVLATLVIGVIWALRQRDDEDVHDGLKYPDVYDTSGIDRINKLLDVRRAIDSTEQTQGRSANNPGENR